MPHCFVVFCKSGYDSCEEKVPLFRTPTDPEHFGRWKKAIPKRDLELKKTSYICAKHFKKEEIIWYRTVGEGFAQVQVRLMRPKLVSSAVPSVFPDCPRSCVPRTPKTRKPPKIREVLLHKESKDQLPSTSLSPKSDACSFEGALVSASTNFSAVTSTSVLVEAETPLLDCEIVNFEPVFKTWNAFDDLGLPTSGSWSKMITGGKKSLVELQFSNEIQPKPVVVKELRTAEESNEVCTFILGQIFSSQIISSSNELIDCATDLFNMNICRGVYFGPNFGNVKTMRNGRKNILNCWQSTECTIRIEMANAAECQRCFQLRRALEVKIKRLTMNTVPATPNKCVPVQRGSLQSSSEKKRMMRRSLKTSMKARQRLKFANDTLKSQVKFYEKKLNELSEETLDGYIKRLNIVPAQAMVMKEIVNIARFSSKHSRRYCNEWLLTSLLMHIRSPSAYKFLSENEILPLPSPRTIKRHLSSVKMDCGFDSSFFEALKKKMESKTDLEKHAVLIFDEVSVRKSIKTDPKTLKYRGIVDFGDDDVGSTQTDKLADHALVFGFSSLMDDYFQPIGCFAAKGGTNGVTLAKLVIQAIILLEKASVKVVGMICDGAKPNRRMWREFGISGKLGSPNHYFQNPYDTERKIFVLSDVPHLFKCIRNRLLFHELMTKFGWVRWRHYEVLFEEEQKLDGNVRMCPKLTEAHIHPCTFARMRVSLMSQVFSRSVSIAIDTYRERLTEELEDSKPTAKFTMFMNTSFDSLNRRYPLEGINRNSSDIDTIQEGLSFLNSWESEVVRGEISVDNFLTKETAEGLRVTLLSTLDLIKYLHEAEFMYVLTAKINQDKMERFFGTIRQAGCQNDHPSMPTFLQLYRLLSTYKLLKPPKFGNCSLESSDCNPTGSSGISMEEFKTIFAEKEPRQSAIQSLKLRLDSLVEQEAWEDEDFIATSADSELTDIIIYYACGYLCRRLLRLSKCDICRAALLTKLDTSEVDVAELVNRKTKGFLLYCNLHLYQLLRKTEDFFAKNSKFSDCYDRTLNDIFENMPLSFPCETHKSDIIAAAIHYYILMRMRQYERTQNRSTKKLSQKKKKEAKVLTE